MQITVYHVPNLLILWQLEKTWSNQFITHCLSNSLFSQLFFLLFDQFVNVDSGFVIIEFFIHHPTFTCKFDFSLHKQIELCLILNSFLNLCQPFPIIMKFFFILLKSCLIKLTQNLLPQPLFITNSILQKFNLIVFNKMFL